MKKIALVGNPNSGKSSLFNRLTGLNQHVGNYPGVTVDKHLGSFKDSQGHKIEVVDLPGTYSLFPKSRDEAVASEILVDSNHTDHPDLVVVVIDATNLERNLLLFTQIKDLGVPVILGLNMIDLLQKEGLEIDQQKLSEMLGNIPVVALDSRKGSGINNLKQQIETYQKSDLIPFAEASPIRNGAVLDLPEAQQIEDTNSRFRQINQILRFCLTKKENSKSRRLLSQRIDKVVTHPIWGYAIFLSILFIIFQAIYELASIPMDLIDEVFLVASQWIGTNLPEGVLTDLIAEGIVPGIGGVVIFIPQIVLLFAFLALLEESGYMSRVVFIMDRLMRPFGLTGKSVVPLMSGVACAIPAIMATRSIDQWKDRLVTILVVPLTSCSARLPVYTLLIALVVPNDKMWGLINYQGLALLSMYLLGFAAALLVALILKFLVKAKQQSFLIMEMPTYKVPRLSNIGLLLLEKTKIFVWEAGKVIMAIAVILWALASYGPPGRMDEAVQKASLAANLSTEEEAAIRLENSWIGIMGKTIEPTIEPLGYNWQMGIALITSFAAREVFVSSMATIYSIGEDFEEKSDTMIERLKNDTNPKTGKLSYNLATGFSLMVFYAFAMQCMSTLAVVKRETKSWKWPFIQFTYMTALAYLAALITYQVLK
ncbi:MAG: ferrous iron transport protein B [Bacteroidota bacterium]